METTKIENILKYTGTKIVRAEPMNELKAVELGYARPNEDNHEWREGYHVIYPDGYQSWSPKSVFENSYKCSETFIDRLKIEHDELNERLDNLRKFIHYSEEFKAIPKEEQVLLISQFGAMQAYQGILCLRLSRLYEAGTKK